MKKKSVVCIVFILIISCIVSVFAGEKNTWDCPNPECGRKGNMGNYCGGCGYPAPWLETTPDPITPTSSPTPTNTPTPALKTVGSVVTFGRYPQTKTGNDRMPIEWIVLDYDETNHKVLLLSKYGLDAVPYNNTRLSVTWEKCTLRTWLNSDFLNNAFTVKEQSAILITEVDNSRNQGYSEWETVGGKNTQDRIFLLSYAEASRYFDQKAANSDNIKSRVAPTPYAIAQGAYTNADNNNSLNNYTADGTRAGWWWLRSPGRSQSNAAVMSGIGSLSSYYVDYDNNVVRPAFWLNLESDIF